MPERQAGGLRHPSLRPRRRHGGPLPPFSMMSNRGKAVELQSWTLVGGIVDLMGPDCFTRP